MRLIERASCGAVDQGKQVIVTTHSPIVAELFHRRELFVCRREGAATEIEPLADLGPLFRRKQIRDALSGLMLQGALGG